MTTATATGGHRLGAGEVGAEVALAAVSLATVAGFARLYADLSFFWPLAAFVVVAHALAALCRHRQLRAVPTAVVAIAAGLVLVGWLLFPRTTAFGLPTPTTLTHARLALDAAATRFGTVIAPAPVLPGFQLAAALALWGAVWFADWSAFRIRATAESVAPCAVLFVFGALLGSPHHRTWTTALFVAAVLLFVLLHRTARQDAGRTWVAATPRRGRRSLVALGAAVGLVAVAGGAAIGPRLPGAESKPLVGWRQTQNGPSSRITVSPLVDIRRRLVEQSDRVAFDVHATQRSYWRLTSLDSFDGQIWSSSGEFARADSALPRGSTPPTVRPIVQDIQIRNLAAIWVPAAYEARQVDGSAALRWDAGSSTLIVDNDRTSSDGLQYHVVSQAPVFTATQLRADRGAPGRAITSTYLRLPPRLPAEVHQTAVDVTGAAATAFDKAIALQQFFRTKFTYDLAVASGHGGNAISSFLADRHGYCEQFAGTYAAMARSIGLPARVAVGFTTGDPDPSIIGLYHVKGKHAHAWPEVYFAGLGWVPFEPTPGRGAPGAEGWTGVPEQQDAPASRPAPLAPTTQAAAPAGPARPGRPSPDAGRVRTAGQPQPGAPASASAGRARTALLGAGAALAALAAAWLLVVLVLPAWRRRRRRHAATTAPARVRLAWDESVEPVEWLTATQPAPWESHAEFAARVADWLGPLSAAHRELAALAAAASWSGHAPDPGVVTRAEGLARTLRRAIRARLSRAQRLRIRLSLRRALGRGPRVRPRRLGPLGAAIGRIRGRRLAG